MAGFLATAMGALIQAAVVHAAPLITESYVVYPAQPLVEHLTGLPDACTAEKFGSLQVTLGGVTSVDNKTYENLPVVSICSLGWSGANAGRPYYDSGFNLDDDFTAPLFQAGAIKERSVTGAVVFSADGSKMISVFLYSRLTFESGKVLQICENYANGVPGGRTKWSGLGPLDCYGYGSASVPGLGTASDDIGVTLTVEGKPISLPWNLLKSRTQYQSEATAALNNTLPAP